MANNNLVYDVEDKPKLGQLLLFALQQVLAVLAATIAVPTIIHLPLQIPAAILGGGIGTLVYLFFTKFKSPVIISSSFAFLGALGNALAFGYMGIVLGAIFAGLVYVIIATIVHFVGTDWIMNLMPPAIVGPTVALIGLSLAPNAVGDLTKASGAVEASGYNLVALLCGLITFFTVVICSVQERFKTAKLLPFIIGILAGYVSASIFSIFGYLNDIDYLKIMNWQPLIDNFENLRVQSFVDYPRIGLIEGIKELATGELSQEMLEAFVAQNKLQIEGAVTLESVTAACQALPTPIAAPTPLNWTGVATVALAFIPVAFVTFAEHVADHANLGTIIGRHLVHGEPGLTRTLLGDGVGSIVGTMFGICPNTTYGESVGCVAITKNASVRTIIAAAIMLIIISFLSPFNAILRTIPNCVMGGVCLTLYGFIAISGIKMFKLVDLSDNKNLFSVSVIFIVGIGGLVINIPIGGGNVIQITSIATALIMGIITKKVCDLVEPAKKEEQPDEKKEGTN